MAKITRKETLELNQHEKHLIWIEKNCPNLAKLEQMDEDTFKNALEALFCDQIHKMIQTLKSAEKTQWRACNSVADVLYICQIKFITEKCHKNPYRLKKAQKFWTEHCEKTYWKINATK